jgi:predicted ribosome quality control (RQC) complex YloA/Tae2 family protein
MFEREIEQVVGELRRLEGSALADVWQPARDRFVLGWRDGTLLQMVPRGPHACLHTIAIRPENPRKPFSFQGACRARIRGVLRALRKSVHEREVSLQFDEGALCLRLSGKSGGLWLLDGERVVASLEGPAPAVLPPLPPHPPRLDPPRFSPVGGSWDLGARAFFTARADADRLARLRADAARSLRERLHRELRLREHLDADLVRADEAGAIRRRAELLAANLWRVPREAATATLTDWETGADTTLTWDPGVSPSKAADRWFAQAKRLERAGEKILERMEALDRSIAALHGALAQVPEAEEDALLRWLGERPRAPLARAAVPWRTLVGPHGETLRIGANEAGNRRLVFQFAKGHHVWMHLRDRPSAHVVLELARGSSPALPHLLAGAQALLDRSGLGAGETADVQYAWVRDLRAVPGGGATVTVSGEKVLRVTSDPHHLEGWTSPSAGDG